MCARVCVCVRTGFFCSPNTSQVIRSAGGSSPTSFLITCSLVADLIAEDDINHQSQMLLLHLSSVQLDP